MNRINDEQIFELITRCRNNDEEAFEQLVEIYTPMLFGAVSAKDLNYDEVFCDVCVALYDAVQSFDLTQSSVTFGLYAKICINNRLRDIIRKNNVEKIHVSDRDVNSIPVASGVASYLIKREERENFHRVAKAALSDYEYSILKLVLAGESISAIAAKTCRDSKSVENAKARIIKKLRKAFSES